MKTLIVALACMTFVGLASAQTYTKFLEKAAEPEDFSESVTIFGSPGSRMTLVGGYSKCTQTQGTLVLCPWDGGFEHIWSNPINYEAWGTIIIGNSSVSVDITGEKAENESGRSAWQGWYQDDHENESIRKIAWKLYDLPVHPEF